VFNDIYMEYTETILCELDIQKVAAKYNKVVVLGWNLNTKIPKRIEQMSHNLCSSVTHVLYIFYYTSLKFPMLKPYTKAGVISFDHIVILPAI